MKRGFTSVLFLLLIAALVATAGYFAFVKKAIAPDMPVVTPVQKESANVPPVESVKDASSTSTALLKDCPDVWYDNRMPMVIEPGQPRPVTQYFIYKGERRELTEFDMNWVMSNCSAKPSAVY